MIERRADLWSIARVEAICVTTNGTLRKDGAGIMGRGSAAQARSLFRGIERRLGHHLTQVGNRVGVLLEADAARGAPIVAFPVKHRWYEPADLNLIEDSARQLVSLTKERGWRRVVLPRPGCGAGSRTWSEVQPVIAPILDDRFLVVWQ